MKTIPTEELRWELTRVVELVVAGNRVVVTFHGKPKFALVSLEDLARLEGKPLPAKRSKSDRK